MFVTLPSVGYGEHVGASIIIKKYNCFSNVGYVKVIKIGGLGGGGVHNGGC